MVPFLHSIYQSRPNRNYNLHTLDNITLEGVWGLGLPPMTTSEELVLERGVFQHGSSLSIVKLPPTREYTFSFKIKEQCTTTQYYAARRKLIDIFNPIHHANGQTSGVVPTPFVYSITIPGYGKFNVSLVYREGLSFDADQALGHRANELEVRVMSPSVWLWEDLVQEEIFGVTSSLGGPVFHNIINHFTSPFFVYHGTWPARFRLEFENNGPAITTLYSIILRDVTNSFSYYFKHVNYPAGGWTFSGVGAPQTFVLDSIQEIATYHDTAPNNQNLLLAASPDSDWRDLQFYPGVAYEIYLETDTALRTIVGSVAAGQGLSFYPRHIGI